MANAFLPDLRLEADQPPDFVSAAVRDVYERATLILADAPPGTRCEVTVTTDAPEGPRSLGTYVFERAPEAADG